MPATNPTPYTVKRINAGQPIISQASFDAVGKPEYGNNINGASVIRLPEWLPAAARPAPDARYYMYFAHHGGGFIRMAYAATIEGPWTLFNVGSNGPGPTNATGRGVLDLKLNELTTAISFPGGVEARRHIASPHVLIDDARRQFVMLFHGPSNGIEQGFTGPQKTFVAMSASGVNFNLPQHGGEAGKGVLNVLFGNAYMHTFAYAGERYAFSNGGRIWKAPDGANPWAPNPVDVRRNAWIPGPNPLQYHIGAVSPRPGAYPRHSSARVLADGHTLEVFYSARGDCPERIFQTTIDLSTHRGDWMRWRTGEHVEILRAELDWEGGNIPPTPSQLGFKNDSVNQLRDPHVFEDDGRTFVFYCAQGEDAMGCIELLPT